MSTSRDDFGIAFRSALLKKGARQKFSLFFLLCLSIFIFFLDAYETRVFTSIRSLINDGIYRVSSISTSPFRFISHSGSTIKKIIFVYKENSNLKKELEILRTEKFDNEYLVNQNKYLRKAIETDAIKIDSVVLAKVLLDKNSPYLKSIIINRGSNFGILRGTPVVDNNYLVGRIVETNYLSSRVLLLGDLNSRIPVTFGKEATQAILVGTGEKKPELQYLPELYEAEGNLTIFTSGKDGIFLPGIPIGKTVLENDKVKVRLFSDPHQLSFVAVQIKKRREKF
jgi:rod shape-determining protein MreC